MAKSRTCLRYDRLGRTGGEIARERKDAARKPAGQAPPESNWRQPRDCPIHGLNGIRVPATVQEKTHSRLRWGVWGGGPGAGEEEVPALGGPEDRPKPEVEGSLP